MKRLTGAALAAVVLAALLWTGARGAGSLPPLGNLLDPANGAWAAARFADLPRTASPRIPNLEASVEVRYDRRGVPHIFASSVTDAVRALGWVVARDRLFQLDAQTHAAAGRLTEWAGMLALPADEEMRRLGLPRAAEATLARYASGSPERGIVDAYSDGVNAYIDGLSRAEWPVEYKLLGGRPERWAPVNSLYLLNRMGWTLAYLDAERARVATAARVGDSAAMALFPVDAVIHEPIVPTGEGHPRFDVRRIPPPAAPDTDATRLAVRLGMPNEDEPRTFASNNWAVAPRRTQNGHALLAGDPHLELTLPSIWYEAHIVVPGQLDVYGVTIPGVPGIVIGFNRDVAWSFTNTGADVLDFFRETVDDSARPTRYQVDGSWRPIEHRIETYRDKKGQPVRVDTVLYTHRGPLSRSGSEWLSMRWVVLEEPGNVGAFLQAPRATTAHQLLDSLAKFFSTPAQNIIAADRSGSIAIRSTGYYPIRAGRADGLTIRDGSKSANDWQGYWPLDRYPQSFDPAQGFLASANQEPFDPRVSPGYLGYENAFEPWRALHINQLLRSDSQMTPDKMRQFQTDPGSARADLFVPYFTGAVAKLAGSGRSSTSIDSAAALLQRWDRRYTRDNEAAVLFESAMRELTAHTWDELAPNGIRRVATPAPEILFELLHDSTNAWWDDRRTRDVVENRDAILAVSLGAAFDSLTTRLGPRVNGQWRWERVGAARVSHLLGLRGFSVSGIPIQGGPGTLNPAGPRGFGPSWRMVVELGQTVNAMGTYPGGQSGNPASPRYLDRLPLWRDGVLDTLFTPADTSGLPAKLARARATLLPKGGAR